MRKFQRQFMVSLVCLILLLFTVIFADVNVKMDVDKQISNQIKIAATPHDISQLDQTIELAQARHHDFTQLLLGKAVEQQQISQKVKEQFSPQMLVNTFMREMDRVALNKKTSKQFNKTMDNLVRHNVEFFSGGIGGTVLVDGANPANEVMVVVFDDHGYFSGKNEVSTEDGQYTITGIPDGEYYVVTWSLDYVDEIYNNIQAPLHSLEGWKDAEMVTVAGAIHEGIDFDLESGAQISGTITDANTGQPLEDVDVNINVLQADMPFPIYSASVYVESGNYSLAVPAKGNVKLVVTAGGYLPSFYSNKTTWEEADVISVASYADDKTNINFALTPNPLTANLGGISGTVTPSGFKLYLIMPAVVGAFNAADTSLAGFGIQLSPLLLPYKINELPAGEYLLYGNDYLGDAIGQYDNYVGAWYDGAVPLEEGEFAENKNIKLKEGGAISGKITDATGAAVDSLMILLLNKDFSLTPDEPFLTQFEPGITSTNTEGNYKFTGLPEGEYILRTFSDFSINFNLEDLDNLIKPGKHAGKIVDEYYNGIHNILLYSQADSVKVTGTSETTGVNFTLSPALYFAGKVTDAATGEPTRDVSLIALDSQSAYPSWPFGNIAENGDYTLGPLPPGKYKLLAVTGFGRDSGYLTEFYNNKRTFFEADSLELTNSNMLNINFELEKGATVQGFVNLGDAVPAGADTMNAISVVAFYADGDKAGKMASFDAVQFNGGYKIEKLLPGSYKVLALPFPSQFAASYYGGGATFDDEAASVITVDFGDVREDHNIHLELATGGIQGTVQNISDGSAISRVLVVAYDVTGHAAGIGISDLYSMDAETGEYTITGLRAGEYYLRSFALSTIIGVLDGLDGIGSIFDNFELDQLSGGLDLDINLGLTLYQDVWYPNIADTLAPDLHNVLFGASAYGVPSEYETSLLPIFMPLPFYQKIPGEAHVISVYAGSITTGINFGLAPTGPGGIINTSVEKEDRNAIATDFTVYQNYPNPFNPSTKLEFYTPENGNVNVTVYNTLGKQIKQISNRFYQTGNHSVSWDGTNANNAPVSAGIYFAHIQAGNEVKIVKMVLVK